MPDARCPHCRADVPRSARTCAACGKSMAEIPWIRTLAGPGRDAPDAQVVGWARSAGQGSVVAMVALWLLVAAGGAVVLGKVRSGAADSRIHEATVREALEDRGIPEDLREGLHHHLDSVGSLWSALEGASWVIVSLGAFGLACEASSFLLTRKLLATEAMQEIARAER